jgi:hypothetical protein
LPALALLLLLLRAAEAETRQHTSANVSIREQTWAYGADLVRAAEAETEGLGALPAEHVSAHAKFASS